MKIVIRGKNEEICRGKLLKKFGLEGNTTKALYGHYGRFINEICAEHDGKQWKVTFEVGKPKK